MTNPDREELVKLADELSAWGVPDTRALMNKAAEYLRRVASSDGGGEPVAGKRPDRWVMIWTDRTETLYPASWVPPKVMPHPDCKLIPLYTAPPADAGMRPTTEDILERINTELSTMAESWVGAFSGLSDGDDVAEYLTGTVWANLATAIDVLTAPGATTKSDGGDCSGFGECAAVKADGVLCPDDTCDYDTGVRKPSTSDPSSTRSEVTADELAQFIVEKIRPNIHCDEGGVWVNAHPTARALLDQFEIRRKK